MDDVLSENNLDDIFKNIQNTTLQLKNINSYQIIINNKTINKYFPLIPNDEKNFIEKCYLYLLDYIYQSFFNNEIDFWVQMKTNNYQDIETIFLLLLPFLKNNKTQSIKSMNSLIYDVNKINIDSFEDQDIRFLSRELKYTNKLITLLNHYKNKKKILNLNFKILILTHLELTITTIRKINNKMMINWNNIYPLKHQQVKINEMEFLLPNNLTYLQQTIENLNEIKNVSGKNLSNNPKQLYNIILKPKGLWMGELYQQIYHRWYQSVLPCKFLIFMVNMNQNNFYGATVIEGILLELLKTDEPIDYSKKFYQLSKEQQDKFNINFKNLREQTYLDEFIKNLDIKKEFLNNIFYNILIHLSKLSDLTNYSDLEENIIDKFKQGSKLVNLIYEDKFDDTIDSPFELAKINFDSKLLDYLEPFEFYNFIYDSIQKFKNTPYFRFLYQEEDNKITYKLRYKDTLPIKWIYNWSKSLVHYSQNFISFGKYFEMEPINITKTFFSRLNKVNSDNWFNIRKNLDRAGFGDVNSNEIHRRMISEYSYQGLNLPYYLILIFDDMIRNGVLSEFKVLPNLTDKTPFFNGENFKLNRKKEFKKLIKENPEWKESYYYWTNQPYNKLSKYSLDPKSNDEDFFKHVGGLPWATFFSNDWITQIDFYTHYLNQQIMYVTGATGQGKSTQVPKLSAYGLKSFFYKYDGHVIGTQPRTAPTRDNINWISKELGIPVANYDKVPGIRDKQEIPTENYYLQFKYQQDKHMNNDKSLKLTMATDGTLLNEISNSITLKKKIKIGNKKTKMTFQNLYDIVMIDEAHEHNPNMDLILSLARQSLYYNPEIRLLIISATMDDDEPLYRSYYSLNDDNHSFPFRHYSLNPNFNNVFIDANLYDRRFHISPPGGTTQYKVEEIYRPIPLPGNITKVDASEKTQKESYQVVKEIADKNPTGEILLFLNGQREINQAVEELNKILPKKTIALPFYSKLHPKYNNIITKIEKFISLLKVKKENVHKLWGPIYQEDPNVPNNSYDRAVIIATNVAEASLTIDRLKFVVDNGYTKENIFNPSENSMSLTVTEISESSRIQRKGRVGRKSSGKAYFLYKKGGREKNLPKLKITQTDPISWMSSFIKNPNQVKVLIKGSNILMIKNTDFHKSIKNIKNINSGFSIDIIKNITQLNLFQKFHYQKNINPPKIFYNTFDEYKNVNMLLDFEAVYWIIHPQETSITRNIFYQLIKYNNKEESKIPEIFQKYTKNYIRNNKDYKITKNIIINSKESELISKIESELEIPKHFATSILYGEVFGVANEVLLTIILLNLFRNDISKIIPRKQMVNKNISSDLQVFIELSQTLINGSLLKEYNINEKIVNKLKNYALKLKNTFDENKYKLDLEDIIYFTKLKKTDDWNNDILITSKIIMKSVEIKKYLKKFGFKFKFNNEKYKKYEEDLNDEFNKIYTKYLIYKNNLSSATQKELELEKIKIRKFQSLCHDKNQKILFCLVKGLENNTVVNLNNKIYDKYQNEYTIKNSICRKTTLLHYLTSNNKELQVLSSLPTEWLLVMNPKYFINYFGNVLINKNNTIEDINVIKLYHDFKNKQYLLNKYYPDNYKQYLKMDFN